MEQGSFGQRPQWQRFDLWVLLAILFWALGSDLLRLWLSGSVGVDDAEIILMGDSLRLGYHPERPPLFNWMAVLAGEAFGLTLATELAVKYLLLTLAGWHYYAAGRHLLRSPATAGAATLGLLLFFHFGYALHLGYTHTVTLLWVMAASLHLLVVMSEARRLWHYLALGLLIGLGLLTKPSDLVFLLAIVAAARLTPPLHRVLRDRRLVLAILLGLAIVLPWALWALEAFQHKAAAAGTPFDLGAFLGRRATALGKYLLACLAFGGPFLAITGALFLAWTTKAQRRQALRDQRARFLLRLLVASVVVMGLYTSAIGASWVRERHLHGVLFFLPLAVFVFLEAAGQPFSHRLWRGRAYLLVALLALAGATGGVVWELVQPPPGCKPCRYQKPLPELAEALAALGAAEGTLITDDEFAGAQIRTVLPELRVYSEAYPFFIPEGTKAPGEGRCLLLWPDPPAKDFEKFQALAEQLRGRPWPADLVPRRFEFPSPRRADFTYAWLLYDLPGSGDCR